MNKNKSRMVKAGIIQLANCISTDESCDAIRTAMIEAHLPYIEQAARQGTQILCFQEIFNGPYFCPSQDTKWYGMTEFAFTDPDGYVITYAQRTTDGLTPL